MMNTTLRLVLLCSGLFFAASVSATPTSYYGIIDAGSGGSRLYLYNVDMSVPSSPKITQLSVANNKVTPGISNNLGDCGGYISPLFDALKAYLTANNIPQSNVTVSLQATAGMRIVSPVSQNACYNAVNAKLTTALPGIKVGPIQTIQGRYEGAFQWITVNYLNGTFTTGPTRGIMETGGGSYQMTFETTGHLNTIDFITVPFAGKAYSLFSRSYTGLGGNFSREDSTDDPNAFQIGFPLSNGAVGTGMYDRGARMTKKIIMAKPTAIPAAAKKPRLASFVGVGLFYNVAESLQLLSPDAMSVENINKAGRALALQPYDPATKDPYAFSNVYNAQLISELIRTWFPAETKMILPVQDTINGSAITWTLGAAAFLAQGGVMQ